MICQGSGLQSRAVIVGDVVRSDGTGLDQTVVVLTWPGEDQRDPSVRWEVRADADGHFAACTVPPDTPVQVDVRVEGSLIRGFEITVPESRIVYRRMQLPLGL